MTRTTAALLVASLLLVLFAWQAQSQPQQGFGPTYDASNQALRVNVVAGGGAGGTSSNFGTLFPGTGTAIGGKDPNGAMASFTISNTGRLQVTCDNCSSAAASFGATFPANGGPGGYKDSLGAFASFTGQNGKQNVIVGNESTIAATVTSSSVLGTAAPTTAYQLGFRDASAALASVTASNGLPVNIIASSVASGGTSSNFGTVFPSSGTAAGFRDQFGAMASATTFNGKLNVIVGNESTISATLNASNAIIGNVHTTSDSTLTATVSTSAALGTAAPTWGFPNAYRDSLGALASWTGANGKGNVIVGNESTLSATVTSSASLGTAAPATAFPLSYRDSLGALASATGNNGKQNVIVDSASNISATLSASNAIVGNVRTTSDSTLTATVTQVTSSNLNVRADHATPTGTNVPTRASYIGGNGSGNLTGFFHCDSQASISTANAGNYRLVASASNATIYVCGYTFVAGTTPVGVKFLMGRDDGSSGSACTGTVNGNPDLTGAMPVAASGGVVNAPNIMPLFHTSANYGLCINLSNGGQVSGHITYTRF